MTAAECCSVLDVPQRKQSSLFTDSVLSSPTRQHLFVFSKLALGHVCLCDYK